MSLEDEILAGRQSVHTDNTKMSFGELANLYKDGDIIISPEFQRTFRWSNSQKTRLIESILLGIPLPSIFVAADDDGRWEIIDGLQRVSTILQLFGLLDQQEFPPLTLESTEYLPDLEGAVWQDADETKEHYEIPEKFKRDIKRASIDVQIVLADSDRRAKFDLFQRLNSFGSILKPQEVRNAALYAINSRFVNWLHKIAADPMFDSLLSLDQRKKSESYAEELILRFLFMCGKDEDEIRAIKHFTDELNRHFEQVAESFDDEMQQRLEFLFFETFRQIAAQPENLFRKWKSGSTNQFIQGFNLTAFEAVACGFGYAVYHEMEVVDDPVETVIGFWKRDRIDKFSTGKSTEQRVHAVVPIGINGLVKKAE